jgi:hypothetical protein
MRSQIAGMTVASDARYIVYGSVRGLVSSHRTRNGAFCSCRRDQAGCERQGGYSDASVYAQTPGGWELVQD